MDIKREKSVQFSSIDSIDATEQSAGADLASAGTHIGSVYIDRSQYMETRDAGARANGHQEITSHDNPSDNNQERATGSTDLIFSHLDEAQRENLPKRNKQNPQPHPGNMTQTAVFPSDEQNNDNSISNNKNPTNSEQNTKVVYVGMGSGIGDPNHPAAVCADMEEVEDDDEEDGMVREITGTVSASASMSSKLCHVHPLPPLFHHPHPLLESSVDTTHPTVARDTVSERESSTQGGCTEETADDGTHYRNTHGSIRSDGVARTQPDSFDDSADSGASPLLRDNAHASLTHTHTHTEEDGIESRDDLGEENGANSIGLTRDVNGRMHTRSKMRRVIKQVGASFAFQMPPAENKPRANQAIIKSSRMILHGHKSGVLTLDCMHGASKKDMLIVSGGNDKLLVVWSSATGEPCAVGRGHAARISGVRIFSPGTQEAYAVTSSWDDKLRVWDISECFNRSVELSGSMDLEDAPELESFVLAGHKNRVYCVDVLQRSGGEGSGSASGSGKCSTDSVKRGDRVDMRESDETADSTDFLIVSGSADSSIRVWSFLERRQLYKIFGHNFTWIITLKVFYSHVHGTDVVVSGDKDHFLKVWAIPKTAPIPIVATSASNSDRPGTESTNDEVSRRRNAGQNTEFDAHLDINHGLEMKRSPKEPSKGPSKPIQPPILHSSKLDSIAAYEEVVNGMRDNIIVTTCKDFYIRLFSLRKGELMRVLEGHQNSINAVSVFYSKNEVHIASASARGNIRLWNPRTGDMVRMFNGHRLSANCVHAFECDLPDGSNDLVVVSGSSDATVRTWLFADERAPTVLKHPTLEEEGRVRVRSVAVLPSEDGDDTKIVTASSDGTLRAWKLSNSSSVEEALWVSRAHAREVNAVAIYSPTAFIVQQTTLALIRQHHTNCQAVHPAAMQQLYYQQQMKSSLSTARDAAGLGAEPRRSSQPQTMGNRRDTFTRNNSAHRHGFPPLTRAAASVPRRVNSVGGGDSPGDQTDSPLWECKEALGWPSDWPIPLHRPLVISGGRDCTVQLTDLDTGKPVIAHPLEGHTDAVTSIAVFDGWFTEIRDDEDAVWPFFVTGSEDHKARVWSLSEGECMYVLDGHEFDISCVSIYFPRHYLSALAKMKKRVINGAGNGCDSSNSEDEDVQNPVVVASAVGGDDPKSHAKSSSELAGVVGNGGSRSGKDGGARSSSTVDAHHSNNGQHQKRRRNTATGALGLAANMGGVLTGLGHGLVHGSAHGQQGLGSGGGAFSAMARLTSGLGDLSGIDYVPAPLIVTGSMDDSVMIWAHDASAEPCSFADEETDLSWRTDHVRTLKDADNAHITCLACLDLYKNPILAVGNGECNVILYSLLPPFDRLHILKGHKDEVQCVKMADVEGMFPVLISGSWDTTINVWNLSTFKFVKRIEGHTAEVSDLAIFTAGGDDVAVASASSDSTARIQYDFLGNVLKNDAVHTAYRLDLTAKRGLYSAGTDETASGRTAAGDRRATRPDEASNNRWPRVETLVTQFGAEQFFTHHYGLFFTALEDNRADFIQQFLPLSRVGLLSSNRPRPHSTSANSRDRAFSNSGATAARPLSGRNTARGIGPFAGGTVAGAFDDSLASERASSALNGIPDGVSAGEGVSARVSGKEGSLSRKQGSIAERLWAGTRRAPNSRTTNGSGPTSSTGTIGRGEQALDDAVERELEQPCSLLRFAILLQRKLAVRVIVQCWIKFFKSPHDAFDRNDPIYDEGNIVSMEDVLLLHEYFPREFENFIVGVKLVPARGNAVPHDSQFLMMRDDVLILEHYFDPEYEEKEEKLKFFFQAGQKESAIDGEGEVADPTTAGITGRGEAVRTLSGVCESVNGGGSLNGGDLASLDTEVRRGRSMGPGGKVKKRTLTIKERLSAAVSNWGRGVRKSNLMELKTQSALKVKTKSKKKPRKMPGGGNSAVSPNNNTFEGTREGINSAGKGYKKVHAILSPRSQWERKENADSDEEENEEDNRELVSEEGGIPAAGSSSSRYFHMLNPLHKPDVLIKTLIDTALEQIALGEHEERSKTYLWLPLQYPAHLDMVKACANNCETLDSTEIFDSEAGKLLLSFAWRSFGWFIHVRAMLIYFVYVALATTSIYMFEALMDDNGSSVVLQKFVALAMIAVIILYDIYFLYQEFEAMRKYPGEYFTDIWNQFDGVVIFGSIAGNILRVWHGGDTEASKVILALSSIAMYFNILYYLRAFESTGPLVSMVLRIAKDLRPLILVLLVIITGFAQAFWILSQSDKTIPFSSASRSLLHSYSFMLGGFDPDGFAGLPLEGFALFLACIFMLIGSILLLNLLIALMSDSYADVRSKGHAQWRLEQAQLICELSSSPHADDSNCTRPIYTCKFTAEIDDSDDEQDYDRMDALPKNVNRLRAQMLAMQEMMTQQQQSIIELSQLQVSSQTSTAAPASTSSHHTTHSSYGHG